MEEQEQAPHIALPLKYRPMTFDDVVGQEHVVRTLRNAIASGRIANAYLFIGPRGIGKTTTSRILAKALNCTNPNGVEPCGACENCRQIAAGRSIDVTELDAASHNKVEDVKPIMDAVQFKPVASKYKIFIIDECHMLTGAAWNALLKTLEEPPPYVKFIFATTEGDKMLATIVSRCQRFDLRRIQTHQIAARLRYICGKEGIEADEDALLAIARGAGCGNAGAVRPRGGACSCRRSQRSQSRRESSEYLLRGWPPPISQGPNDSPSRKRPVHPLPSPCHRRRKSADRARKAHRAYHPRHHAQSRAAHHPPPQFPPVRRRASAATRCPSSESGAGRTAGNGK